MDGTSGAVSTKIGTRGEERVPEANANMTTTGGLYRAATRYACMRGTFTQLLRQMKLSKWIGGATAFVREPRCLLHRIRISLVKAQLRPYGLSSWLTGCCRVMSFR